MIRTRSESEEYSSVLKEAKQNEQQPHEATYNAQNMATSAKDECLGSEARSVGSPLEMCMPIGIILRDVLELSRSQRESKRILATKKVMVDGRVVDDHGRAVGLMDVLTVGDENYRCILDTNGKLRYRAIPKKEASAKLCRIINKITIKGGKRSILSMTDEHSFPKPPTSIRQETLWSYPSRIKKYRPTIHSRPEQWPT